MAYTNVWTVTVPTGTEAISTGDNEIRKLRLDIQERMATLGFDWTTDPVSGPEDTTKSMYVHLSAFTLLTLTSSTTTAPAAGNNYGLAFNSNGSAVLYAPVLIPRGAIITSINFTAGSPGGTAASATCKFGYVNATTASPTDTVVTTISTGASPAQAQYASATLAHTVDATAANYIYYYLLLNITSTGFSPSIWFQGVQISYTTPTFNVAI